MRCTASKQPTPTRGVESIIYKAVDRRTIQSTQRIHAQFMLAELSAGRTFALLSQRRGGTISFVIEGALAPHTTPSCDS